MAVAASALTIMAGTAVALARPTMSSTLVATGDSARPPVDGTVASGTTTDGTVANRVVAGRTTEGRRVPDGRISLEELTAVPLDLPMWGSPVPGDTHPTPPCPTAGVTLRQGYSDMLVPYVSQIDYGDVDRDGAAETVAMLTCIVYQSGRLQVVAFDRDASGAVVVLGQVIRQGLGTETIKNLYDFTVAGATGSVGVQVGDRQPCCGVPDAFVEHQRRWYTWDGEGFVQTGGPTAFHPIPSQYGEPTVTVTALSLGPASGGKRRGSTTVTITNPGPASAPGVRIDVVVRGADYSDLSAAVRITAKGAKCATGQTTYRQSGFICHCPALAAGASTVVSLTVTSPVANDPVLSGAAAEVAVGPEQPGIRLLTWGYEGSRAAAAITIAG